MQQGKKIFEVTWHVFNAKNMVGRLKWLYKDLPALHHKQNLLNSICRIYYSVTYFKLQLRLDLLSQIYIPRCNSVFCCFSWPWIIFKNVPFLTLFGSFNELFDPGREVSFLELMMINFLTFLPILYCTKLHDWASKF